MLNPRISEGAPATLFQRLVDHQPDVATEFQPLRTLNRQQLRASVREELERLLNTRCSVPPHLLTGRDRSVIDYGIPDFSGFSGGQERARMEWFLARTIAAFEPRLKQVRVAVDPAPDQPGALLVTIRAHLAVGSITEPVSFPTVFQQNTGKATVSNG